MITALFEDGDGTLWLGAFNEVARFRDGHWRADGITAQIRAYIHTIQRDRAGDLWIGSDQGAYRLSGDERAERLRHYTTQDGLRNNEVRLIYQDRAGALWFGGPGGLARFKDNRFTTLTEADGLSSNQIFSIYEDGAGALHDSLSQNLVIIKNRAMISLQQRDDPEEAFEQVAEIAEAADHALFEVREIAHNLRPYQLERLGLTNTLEFMMRGVRNSSDIEFTVELENVDGLLSPESEINLYRIVQELINNVIKHSDATEAWLSVKRTAAGAQVICRDNGKGFDPALAATSRQSGMGLSGLAERVRILGGQYTIESAPGKGAMVTVVIDVVRQ